MKHLLSFAWMTLIVVLIMVTVVVLGVLLPHHIPKDILFLGVPLQEYCKVFVLALFAVIGPGLTRHHVDMLTHRRQRKEEQDDLEKKRQEDRTRHGGLMKQIMEAQALGGKWIEVNYPTIHAGTTIFGGESDIQGFLDAKRALELLEEDKKVVRRPDNPDIFDWVTQPKVKS